MAICRGCGATITWVKTPRGKEMPVDLQLVEYWLVPKGGEKIVTPDGEVVSCTTEPGMIPPNGKGYRPHWASCPAAGTFRR